MITENTNAEKLKMFNYEDGIILKNNLFLLLDTMISKKVTYIHGPAGFGKTTAVSYWIKKNNYSSDMIWLNLSETENSQNNLLQLIINSLAQHFSTNIAVNYDKNGNISNIPLNKLSKVMKHISKTKEHFFIVIDNFEILKDRSLFEAVLDRYNFIPSEIHYIIISKTRPLTGLSELKLSNSFLEIGPYLLKFDKEEINYYFNTIHKLNLSAEIINNIKSFCDGWPSILKLIILTIKETKSIKYSISINNYYINDYLNIKIFHTLDENIKDFMIKTSVLSSLNYELCMSLTENADTPKIVEFLYRSDFLTGCKESENLKYNSLITSFLRNKLFKYKPEIVKELNLFVAKWCEKNDLIDNAVEYYLKVEDYSSSIRLLEKYAPAFLSKNSEYNQFIVLVDKLPKEHLLKSPILIIYYSTFLALLGKLDREESLLFIKGINLESEPFNDYKSEIFSIRLTSSIMRLDLEYGLALCEKFDNTKPTIEIFDQLMNATLGEFYFYIGDFNKATFCYKKYIDCLNHSLSIFLYFASEFVLSCINFFNGELYASRKLCINTLNTLADSNKSLNCIKYSFSILLSSIFYELNNIEKALYYINEAINITDENINRGSDIILKYCILCNIYICKNQHDKALNMLDNIQALIDEHKSMPSLSLYTYNIIILLDKMNRFDMAKDLILKCSITCQNKKYFAYESQNFAVIFLLFKENRLEEALDLLDDIKDSILNSERVSSKIQYFILLSIVSNAYGLKEDAAINLQKALKIGHTHHYCRIFLDHMNYIRDILKYLNITDIHQLKASSYKIPEFIANNNVNNFTEETNLSQREKQVLKLVVDGLSNQEISGKIYISESTVKKHINNIYTKLNVKNRAQAIKVYNDYAI